MTLAFVELGQECENERLSSFTVCLPDHRYKSRNHCNAFFFVDIHFPENAFIERRRAKANLEEEELVWERLKRKGDLIVDRKLFECVAIFLVYN